MNIRKLLTPYLVLTLVVWVVYGPVVRNDFIVYDEEQYVTKNPRVQAGLSWEGIKWAFTTLEAGFWQPLVWISHMLDCTLYAMNPGGHHLTSLLIHTANVLLLFLVSKTMTGAPGRSAFVAMLLAVHPLHVESVAWVADRKDLLCALFWLSTLFVYSLYVDNPGPKTYLPVLLLFALGLMTKPMIVTLPVILLFIDFWPLGRYPRASHREGVKENPLAWRLVVEKIPLLLMALPVIMLTFRAEAAAGALPSYGVFPLHLRLENALVNIFRYLGKAFFPLGLSVFYPQPRDRLFYQPLVVAVALAVVTVFFVRGREKYPYLLVGWLWYITVLLPVSGLVQVGSHVMADRYTYLPLMGVYMAISWGIYELAWKGGWVKRLWVPAVLLVLMLSLLSWRQVHVWRDTETLFRHAVTVTKGNYLAHSNLGAFLLNRGRIEEAQGHFREALRIRPFFLPAMINLGNALVTMGDREGGMTWYRRVLAKEPDHPLAMRNLADALALEGRVQEALSFYGRLLAKDSENPELNNNYGVALVMAGRREEGIAYIRRALGVKPDYGEARNNLKKLGYGR